MRARATAAGSTSLYAKVLVLVAALGAPIVVAALGLVVVAVLVVQETPPDTSQEYVAIATPKGRCLARVVHYPGGVEAYDFDGDGPAGVKDQARFPPKSFKHISVKALVGLTVIDQDGIALPVRRVYRTKLDEKANYVELDAGEDVNPTQPVIGSCLAGDKPPRRVLTYDDPGHPLLVAPAGREIVVGFSDALYSASSGGLRQLWKSQGSDAALAMLADDDAVYVELPRQALRVTPNGKAEVLAQMPVHAGHGIAIDEHTLYFADERGVARVACAGGKVEQVLLNVVPNALGASGGAVVWIDSGGDVRARTADADTPVELGHDAAAKHGVAIAQSKAWWVSKGGELLSSLLAGGAPERHGKLDGIDGAFAIRGDSTWWGQAQSDSHKHGKLLSRPLAGGASLDHAPGAGSVDAFGFAGGQVYWIDADHRWLMQREL